MCTYAELFTCCCSNINKELTKKNLRGIICLNCYSNELRCIISGFCFLTWIILFRRKSLARLEKEMKRMMTKMRTKTVCSIFLKNNYTQRFKLNMAASPFKSALKPWDPPKNLHQHSKLWPKTARGNVFSGAWIVCFSYENRINVVFPSWKM